jgi:uncharacterized OsmC-like protein
MSEERTHHVTIRLARGYQFVAEFNDMPDAPSMLFDEPEPLGTNRAPNAVAVLGAAIGNCLAASLTFCLRRARVDVENMTAHVTTHVAKNDQGRFRVSGIDVALSPGVEAAEASKLERCEQIFKDFCMVTASVERGIPVRVSFEQEAAQAA